MVEALRWRQGWTRPLWLPCGRVGEGQSGSRWGKPHNALQAVESSLVFRVDTPVYIVQVR